jgi:medium-chain acyl-[acyl-carrier-protein] hydrolase
MPEQTVRLSPWILARRRDSAAVRLFCFPYAGGGASIFRGWTAPPNIELCAVQLPGREERIGEAPYASLDDLVPVLGRALLPFLDRPFAFFGHSMGAIIAHEVASWLTRVVNIAPVHLFLSGRRAPHMPDRHQDLHLLSDEALVREITTFEGTSADVLADPELMSLMLPLIRADFTLCSTYKPQARPPLRVPIDVLGGRDDPYATPEELDGWSSHTRRFGGVHLFDGHHFYLTEHWREIMRVVAESLAGTRRPSAFQGAAVSGVTRPNAPGATK